MRVIYLNVLVFGLLLTGCATSSTNMTYEKSILTKTCDAQAFADDLEKIKKNDDTIYVGINAGSVARGCKDYNLSNEFFDAAEESYKNDVDLEGAGTKVGKVIVSALASDAFTDYDGSLHERIMVNVYKGLNFMALNDYDNARVEFNRAQIRQEKAKEYFAKQIEANKDKLEEAKKDPNYSQNMGSNMDTVNSHYEHLFAEFASAKDFTNPYASYLSSVFYFLDGDYTKAEDKFKEIVAINKDSKDIQNLAKIYEKAASKSKKIKQKYIFLSYEDGFGTIKSSFNIDLPFIINSKVVSTHVNFPTIKKREASFGDVLINGNKSFLISDFDQIVATEFKTELPSIIAKTIASTITKTVISAVIAKNDPTGGFISIATSITMGVLNKSDIRSWMSLPKTARIAILPNKGEFTLTSMDGSVIAQSNLDPNKNALVIVRSYQIMSPADVFIIER